MSDTMDNYTERVWYDAPTDTYIRARLWQEGDERYVRKIMVNYYWAKTNIPEVKLKG